MGSADCMRAYATLGEIMAVLRAVFGEYREPTILFTKSQVESLTSFIS